MEVFLSPLWRYFCHHCGGIFVNIVEVFLTTQARSRRAVALKNRLIGWYLNQNYLNDFKGKNLSLFSYEQYLSKFQPDVQMESTNNQLFSIMSSTVVIIWYVTIVFYFSCFKSSLLYPKPLIPVFLDSLYLHQKYHKKWMIDHCSSLLIFRGNGTIIIIII